MFPPWSAPGRAVFVEFGFEDASDLLGEAEENMDLYRAETRPFRSEDKRVGFLIVGVRRMRRGSSALSQGANRESIEVFR
jgi:hypothetical protein